MEKRIDNIDNLSNGAIKLSAECEFCGSENIDIYIDTENATMVLYCTSCNTKEEIYW